MSNSVNLGLPFIEAAQAQKHVTHNEALKALDAIVQLTVLDRDLTAAPGSPANGDRYIVAAGATGSWLGKDGEIAAFQDGAWVFYSPREGWLAWVADEDKLLAWDGTAWNEVSGTGGGGSVNPTPLVGVNATADTTNRLSVSSPASLFNHEGAGHQLKLNKNLAADTASLLFQTGFSGRTEMGLAGDDDYHFKVSSDGSIWNEAIVINRATGEVTFPNSSTVGEANTASNISVGGVGLFDGKVGVDLKFKNLNAGDGTITITDDVANNEVDLKVAAGAITGTQLAANSVGTAQINADAVTLAELEHGTQGDILYYGAGGTPARLGFGVSGQFLKTQGAGVNPVWETIPADVKTVVSIIVFDDSENCVTGNGAGDVFWRVPSILNGYNLVEVAAQVQTVGTTGTMDIQIANVTDTTDMLSTKITIDSGELDSSTAATPAVINAATDDVATGDQLRIDVDAIHTTPAAGLLVELTFQLP